MKKTGAEIVWEVLQKEGVTTVFGYPGGTVLPLYDKLKNYPKIHHVLVRHEQGAAHAADGYGRASNTVGVCLATSGPGATNLVTGIATAFLDSSPLVAITGQVAVPSIGTDAFQEADITGITLPITKHNFLVDDVHHLAQTLKQAFHIAQTGRPGPVLVDIPKDVQTAEAEFDNYDEIDLDLPGFKPKFTGSSLQIKKAIEALDKAEKPLIITGRGVIISQAHKELLEFAEKLDVPVVTTLLGISGFPEDHPLFLGYVGMHGFLYANRAIQQADLLISLGSRFSDRITGTISTFAPEATVIHIDIDPAEISKVVTADIPIVGDAKNILRNLILQSHDKKHTAWLKTLAKEKKNHPIPDKFTIEHNSKGKTGRLNPLFVLSKIRSLTPADSCIVSDVGQNQMWVAQHYQFKNFNTHFSSGGLGTMGFALPAATGVKFARPQQTVWTICGDGGFQMTFQQLGAMVQECLGIKIAIFNNGFLGMVRQWQELFYCKNYEATPLLNPDFGKIASAYGIPYLKIETPEQVEVGIKKALKDPGIFMLEFVIEEEKNVFPMVPPGAGLNDTRVE